MVVNQTGMHNSSWKCTGLEPKIIPPHVRKVDREMLKVKITEETAAYLNVQCRFVSTIENQNLISTQLCVLTPYIVCIESMHNV